MPGDADGSTTVNATDANAVLQHVVGLTTLEGANQQAADVDGNAVQAAPDQVGDETMDVYKNVVKMALTIDEPVADQQYVVMLLNGENNEVPTTNNIRYIDQNDTGSFTIYPDDMNQPSLYNVVVTPSENETNVVYPFEVTQQPYTVGDADESGAFDVGDVVCLLKHLASKPVTINLLAADADASGGVDVGDVVKMLKVLAQKDEF